MWKSIGSFIGLFSILLILVQLSLLKIFVCFVNFFLILVIFFRVPQDNVGLASFATKSNLLGSPSSAKRALDILTFFGIITYFIIALQLNFLNN